jgi:hypothetical protein
MAEPRSSNPSSGARNYKRKRRGILFNGVILVLSLVVGYLAYSLVDRTIIAPPVDPMREDVNPGEVIQIDVLNGCGVDGAASVFTSYLRGRGYDVVEMRNYKTFDVVHSLVIDRKGNLETAKKVAYALGVREDNIVQQLNADYYVDASIVIGKDYKSLKPYH